MDKGKSGDAGLFVGIRAAITTIEPMKKRASRHRVVWIALGGLFRVLASPAVIPINSVPEKGEVDRQHGGEDPPIPVGKRPSLVRFVSPGALV